MRKKRDKALKIVEPHKLISKEVREKDYKKVLEISKEIAKLCLKPIGKKKGAYAIAHAQVVNDNPLRFFVMRSGEVVLNPVIVRHTNAFVDSLEGCISYADRADITVPRWNKCIVEYDMLYEDGKVIRHNESLSGHSAKVFQHEIDHMNGRYIYGE